MYTKIIEIGLFLTELINKYNVDVFERQCIQMAISAQHLRASYVSPPHPYPSSDLHPSCPEGRRLYIARALDCSTANCARQQY